MKPFKPEKVDPEALPLITVRLSPEDGRWIRQYARDQGMRIGTLTRQMLEHMIREIRGS
jgi:hypothetical protein